MYNAKHRYISWLSILYLIHTSNTLILNRLTSNSLCAIEVCFIIMSETEYVFTFPDGFVSYFHTNCKMNWIDLTLNLLQGYSTKPIVPYTDWKYFLLFISMTIIIFFIYYFLLLQKHHLWQWYDDIWQIIIFIQFIPDNYYA